jgi:flagellar protein FliO/FliZ
MELLISPVLAATAPHGENAPLDLAGSTAGAHAAGGGSLVRTIVGLAIVLAVIFGLRWVLKQVKASREERADGTGLTAMGSLALGSNRSLHVVRAGREVLVVGSGEQGVTAVRSYGEEEARALGILEEDGTDAALAAPAGGMAKAGGAAVEGATLAAQRALDTLRAWTVRG